MKAALRDMGRHEVGALPRCRGILTVVLGEQIVRVVYSDESGLGSMDDEPVVVVTALVLNMDKQWKPLEKDLQRVISAIPEHLLERKIELKGKKLLEAARRGKPEAIEALKALLLVAVAHNLPLFHGAVDRKGFVTYDKIRWPTDRDMALRVSLSRSAATALNGATADHSWCRRPSCGSMAGSLPRRS